jgi:hypothetical protein
MEYRPNSRPEISAPIRPEALNRMLEHYIMHRALVRWDGLRHTSFNLYSARLLSFDNWTKHMKPTPKALSAAGFFHVSYVYLTF